MDRLEVSFTAAYLKSEHGYVGFVEELPGVSSYGHSIEEARENLQRQAIVVFDEERAQSADLLQGKNVVREHFRFAIPGP